MKSARVLHWALVAVCAHALLGVSGPHELLADTAMPAISRLAVTPALVVEGRKVTATGAALGGGGGAATLAWDFGDGSSAVVGARVQHVYAAAGRYVIALTATADAEPPATQDYAVTVHPKSTAGRPAATLSSTHAVPFQYVSVFGGFQAGAPTAVEFLFGSASVLVTPPVVTARMVRVAVPPLLKGAAFIGGTAQVRVIQGTGASAVFTYAGRLKVGKLPKVTLPPGETTKSFVRVTKSVLADANAAISGTALDTPENADTIASALAFCDAMTANVDAALGAKRSRAAAVADASQYTLDLSVQTVKQLDSYYAGVVAAGPLDTNDAQTALAYRDWSEAMRVPPGHAFDAAMALRLGEAEQKWKDQVRRDTQALTEGLNAMMAPTTTSIATLTLMGTVTGNPAVLLAAAQLALCSDVLTTGLIAGLALDAALAHDGGARQTYLTTAGNLFAEFATGKLLGAVAKLAFGGLTAEFAGSAREIANGFGAKILTFESLTQPPVPAELSVSISDASVAEGDSGSTDLLFTVTLSASSANTVTVKWATADGTASAGSDYTAVHAATLTFGPGETTKFAAVRVLGDTSREASEKFSVILSSPSGAAIDRTQATGTILNDDAQLFTADSGSNDFLGSVSGCGFSTDLSLDGSVHFEVTDGGPGGTSSATVTASVYSPDYGSNGYEWQGPLTWSGSTLSGSLTRTSNPARPPVAIAVTVQPGGAYALTATVPLTYNIYLLDGTCTGPIVTFNHQATGVVLSAQ